MPVHRKLLADCDRFRLEQVRAPSSGDGWGAVHQAEDGRCVLPGTGQVQWRSGDELLVVDPLTAFCLRPGERYQLRHERERAHLVLSSSLQVPVPFATRAWLLRPQDVFRLALACRWLRRGDATVHEVAARMRDATARAVAVDAGEVVPALAQARRFMALHAGAKVSLPEIGEAVRCSEFALMRLFRRHLRISPHQYRLRLRLALAVRHLEAGEADLAGLAHELGFSSQSHFGEVFRLQVGLTPAAARQALA